jgi:metal-sulfur cluster biosynthetic enzyme
MTTPTLTASAAQQPLDRRASLAMTETSSLAMTEIEQRAWALIEHLSDPEIPVVSLRELGILRDVREGAQGLEVVITPTYSGCPAMGQIEDDVKAALSAGGLQATVVTQLAPAGLWHCTTTRLRQRAVGWGQRGAVRGTRDQNRSGPLPAMRLGQHHRNLPFRLHRLQGPVQVPGLHGTVRLLQTLLNRKKSEPSCAFMT